MAQRQRGWGSVKAGLRLCGKVGRSWTSLGGKLREGDVGGGRPSAGKGCSG